MHWLDFGVSKLRGTRPALAAIACCDLTVNLSQRIAIVSPVDLTIGISEALWLLDLHHLAIDHIKQITAERYSARTNECMSRKKEDQIAIVITLQRIDTRILIGMS
jgi:hypothetical protein